MEEGILAIIWLIIFSIGALIMVVYLRKFSNQEKMAMIEKGMSPGDFKPEPRNSSISLRASLLLMGAGAGLLFGYFLDMNFRMQEVGYFSMLFIFGGIGLGLSYLIEEKKNKEFNK
jgi:preprotein translocase subunit SecG